MQLPLSETYIRTNTQAVLTNAQLISAILGLFGAFGACATVLSQLRKLKTHTEALRTWSVKSMKSMRSPRMMRTSQLDSLDSARDTSRLDVIDVVDVEMSSRTTERTARSEASEVHDVVAASDDATAALETASSDSPLAQKARPRVGFRANGVFADDPGTSSWVAQLPGDVRDKSDDMSDDSGPSTPPLTGPYSDHPSVRTIGNSNAFAITHAGETPSRSLHKKGRRDELAL